MRGTSWRYISLVGLNTPLGIDTNWRSRLGSGITPKINKISHIERRIKTPGNDHTKSQLKHKRGKTEVAYAKSEPNSELVAKYFEMWKIVYVNQVKFEINAQWAISTIFDVLENRIHLNQSKFLYSLTSFYEQKKLVEQVKIDFKKKVTNSGYLKIKEKFKKATKIINNVQKRIDLKLLSTTFHKWHYKAKVEANMEAQSKHVGEKQRKLNKMKKWWYVLGFGLLNDLVDKKRESIIKDVQKAQILSRFMRWKKFVAVQKFTEMQNKAQDGHLETQDDYTTISDDSGPDLEKYKKQNDVNKMILKNQLQIGLSLQKDIRTKQDLIKNDLRYKMGAAVIKSLLMKKKRLLLKKFFTKWSGELRYSEALMYHKLIKQSKEKQQIR